MGSIFKVKPRLNKANGQVNFSIPRKKMSSELKELIKMKTTLKFKFEGADK